MCTNAYKCVIYPALLHVESGIINRMYAILCHTPHPLFLSDVTLNAIACTVISVQGPSQHFSNYMDMKNTDRPPVENEQKEK